MFVRDEHEYKDDIATLGGFATQFGVQSRGAIMGDEEHGLGTCVI